MIAGLTRGVAVAAVTVAMAVPVCAAPVNLERVVLLPALDRSSVVFELNAEPDNVTSRRLSDSVLELEAGFSGVTTVATGGAAPKLLKAPPNVRFIDSVTVRTIATPSGPVVRARITLSAAMAQAVVRSSGRRVYVDVSALPKPAPAISPARGAATQAAAATAPAAPSLTTPETNYRTAVRASLDKLKEMSPFLSSAAAAGDLSVAGALLPALVSVRTSLSEQLPPDAARGSHAMVVGAVDRILRALAPDFVGDRGATVKQSLTTIEVVGGVLSE